MMFQAARCEKLGVPLVLTWRAAQHVCMAVSRFNSQPTVEQLPDLMAAVASRRDRHAFEQLFLYFAPRVKSYLRGMKVDEKLAEDLAQEVLLTVWRRAGQYDPMKAALSTWIFTIARNRWIDVVRREKRPEIDPNDPAIIPDPIVAPDQAYNATQAAARVRAAIATLPGEQATLLRASFFEERSHSELAEELMLPLGTVKSRLRLAMAKLRSVLEDVVR